MSLGVEISSLSAPREALVTLVLGLVVGAAWQLVYRRDLVERLFPATVLLGVLLVLGLGLPGGQITVERSSSMTAVGLVMGLVLAETWLRSRDRAA